MARAVFAVSPFSPPSFIPLSQNVTGDAVDLGRGTNKAASELSTREVNPNQSDKLRNPHATVPFPP